MIREHDRMGEIGLQLRAHVGDLMLRRMKEDELTGLPKKSGHNQAIPVEMTAEQVSVYDAKRLRRRRRQCATEGLILGE